MNNHNDHSHHTHTAACDSCDYMAKTHAHDDESAAMALSEDLAEHNKEVHDKETDVQEILEDVTNKMKMEQQSSN